MIRTLGRRTEPKIPIEPVGNRRRLFRAVDALRPPPLGAVRPYVPERVSSARGIWASCCARSVIGGILTTRKGMDTSATHASAYSARVQPPVSTSWEPTMRRILLGGSR